MRLLQLLQEDRIDFLTQQYGQKILDVIRNMVPSPGGHNASLDYWVKHLAQYDPSGDKKYLQWIIRMVIAGRIRVDEDLEQTLEDLKRFDELKPHLEPALRDINRYRSPGDLANQVLLPHEDTVTDSQRKQDAEQDEKAKEYVRVVYDGPEGKVLEPTTEGAACFLGRGTRWCTAARNNNAFHRYNQPGDPLYVILTPDGRKAQFHFGSQQFMDEQDDEIPEWPRATLTHDIRGRPVKPTGIPPSTQRSLYGNYRWISKIPEIAEKGERMGMLWMFENPTDEDMIRHAIRKNWKQIELIENPSREVQKLAIQLSGGKALRFLKNPDMSVIEEELQRNPQMITMVRNPSPRAQMIAVQYAPDYVHSIDNVAPEVQDYILRTSPKWFEYVHNPLPEMDKRYQEIVLKNVMAVKTHNWGARADAILKQAGY